MDETGFRIGVGRLYIIITSDEFPNEYIIDPDNRDYATIIKYISATGYSLSTFLILTGAVYLAKQIIPDLDSKIKLGVSKTDYSNDNLNLEQIKHFN